MEGLCQTPMQVDIRPTGCYQTTAEHANTPFDCDVGFEPQRNFAGPSSSAVDTDGATIFNPEHWRNYPAMYGFPTYPFDLVSRRQTLYTNQARTSLYRVCWLPRGSNHSAFLLGNSSPRVFESRCLQPFCFVLIMHLLRQEPPDTHFDTPLTCLNFSLRNLLGFR
jgi:hypothetical protein